KRGFSSISIYLQTKKHLSKVQVKHENVKQLLSLNLSEDEVMLKKSKMFLGSAESLVSKDLKHDTAATFLKHANQATEQPSSSDADFSSETPTGKKSLISRWKIKRKRRTPSTIVASMATAEERKISADQLKLKINMEMEQKREKHEISMAASQEEHILNMKIKQEPKERKPCRNHD
ncbi:hypothetical protein AVEN_34349-3-1, partial [Araneus ventricosus]